MQAEEFHLVREALRDCAGRHACSSAEVKPAERSAAQRALDGLGLAGLRAGESPSATAQECALLAEEWGVRPQAASFLGPVLLAPELLRLLGDGSAEGAVTVALADDLGFPHHRQRREAVAWDCAGADGALHVAAEGTVSRLALADAAPATDPLRPVRSVAAGVPATVLGRLDRDGLRAWEAWALTMVTGELVGAAASFLAQAVEYAGERVQYGRPIGTFQAVRHLLADAHVAVEACTSAVLYAAWCLDDATPEEALTAARAAKAEANESAVAAVHTGMQVFGGIAQTWEHVAHLYLRRVRLGATVLAGDADLLPALASATNEPTGTGEER